MRLLKHPATVIATVALFLAMGGGAAAFATGLISGSKIKNHSIPAKKLTKSAIKSLRGKRGPAGPAGATGAAGPAGPQGPGGAILTYDAAATASPTVKAVGTLMGVTYGAACTTSSGSATVSLYLKTTDGSWSVDVGDVSDVNGTTASGAFTFSQPAGTFSTSTFLTSTTANSGGNTADFQYELLQFKPSPGSLIWHLNATTVGGTTCHASLQGIPETLTAVTGTPHAAVKQNSRRLHFG